MKMTRWDLLIVILAVNFGLVIVLPMSANARSGGKSALCLANLHILGRAWTAYQEDNDGKLVNGLVPRNSLYADPAYWMYTHVLDSHNQVLG